MGFDEESEVWKPYSAAGAAAELIRSLVTSSGEVSLEGPDAQAIFRAVQYSDPHLAVEMSIAESVPFRSGERLTVRFDFEGEKYFFHCSPVFNGAVAQLEVKDLFQLQRRRHFRVAIPDGFPSRIEVKVRHANRPSLRGSILNINTFGLGFEVNSIEEFDADELIDMEVQLGERKVVHVAGRVRHVRSHQCKTQVGLQFDHAIHKSQDAIQTILSFFRHDSFYFQNKK